MTDTREPLPDTESLGLPTIAVGCRITCGACGCCGRVGRLGSLPYGFVFTVRRGWVEYKAVRTNRTYFFKYLRMLVVCPICETEHTFLPVHTERVGPY